MACWVVLFLTACDAGSPGPVTVTHPTPENIPAELRHVDRRPRGTVERLPGFGGFRRLHAIGSLDGVQHTVWGSLEDVAAESSGGFHAVDSHYSEVRSFSRNGEYLGAFGRQGGGPAEFRNPLALASVGNGRLAIVTGNSRVKLFARDRSGEYSPAGTINYIDGQDACSIGNNLIIRGFRIDPNSGTIGSNIVHVYDALDRSLDTSIVEVYRSPSRLVQLQISKGLIECVPDHDLFVVVDYALPYVRAFSKDGSFLWATKLGPFVPMMIQSTARPGGGHSVTVAIREGTSRILSLNRVSPDHLLVQTITFGKQNDDGSHSSERRDSFLLSAATGRGQWVGDTLGWVIAAGGDRLFVLGGKDFPTLEVISYDFLGTVAAQ